MPITINCPCGKKLLAKDDVRGKNVKCPNCSKVLHVPVDRPRGAPSTVLVKCECGKVLKVRGSVSAAGLKCPSCDRPVRLKPASKKTQVKPGQPAKPKGLPCPQCGERTLPGAGVCVHCSTNIRIGQQITTLDPATMAARKKRMLAAITVTGILVVFVWMVFIKK